MDARDLARDARALQKAAVRAPSGPARRLRGCKARLMRPWLRPRAARRAMCTWGASGRWILKRPGGRLG
ncbi:hypothetical protein [Methanothrix sp.]|uniref:hypothetical protein n=1 Tax=Methanothrix sp. TaxID=90426 RepID=UPI003BB48BCA